MFSSLTRPQSCLGCVQNKTKTNAIESISVYLPSYLRVGKETERDTEKKTYGCENINQVCLTFRPPFLFPKQKFFSIFCSAGYTPITILATRSQRRPKLTCSMPAVNFVVVVFTIIVSFTNKRTFSDT